MQRRAFMLATGGLCLVGAGAARAQILGDAGSGPSQVLAVGGASLRASQLALQRSRSARIRDFAQLEANEQAAVAAALGAPPGSVPPNAEDAAMLERLASLAGRDFDRLYVEGQVRGHHRLLELNQADQGAGDPVSRAVAIVSVPSIQTHLQILSGLRGAG